MSLSLPNDTLRPGTAASYIDDEPRNEASQVNAPVEPVGESAEVGVGVFAVLECLVSARERSFEVTVLTHLNSSNSQGLRRLTTVGTWLQPAFTTAAKHAKPSLATLLPGLRLVLAHCLTASLVKPAMRLSLR
jgi:hypothetical protein